ncbi:MAG: CAP domain-containing protein [Clostridia bacterium]|nr:CAP domain-containing protein [Clostridia bacterium]
MKRKIIYLVVVSLIFSVLSGFVGFESKTVSAAPAPTFQRVNFIDAVVMASYLNVRQGPSEASQIVCVLKKGQKVKIFGKIADWYAVYEPGGKCVGTVKSEYVKALGVAKAPTPTTKVPSKTTAPPKTLPKPQPSGMNKPATGVTQEEQTLLDLCNKARAEAGVGPLQFDMELMKVAKAKAQDMVNNNYFSHQSPTYGSPFDMMRQFGVSFRTAGENIAGNQSVEGAFKAWMNSEGHRKNILSGNFNYVGFGIVSSPTYGKVLVQQFIGR